LQAIFWHLAHASEVAGSGDASLMTLQSREPTCAPAPTLPFELSSPSEQLGGRRAPPIECYIPTCAA
jgi:hypothetical protein